MTISDKGPTLLGTINTTVGGFWSGWLGGSTILAGGKIWTMLFDPKKKVSGLLGHIGTPGFRRELAVGMAVYALTSCIFAVLAEHLKIKSASATLVYSVLTQTISIAIASLSATAITYVGYHYVLYVVSAISIAIVVKGIFDYTQKK